MVGRDAQGTGTAVTMSIETGFNKFMDGFEVKDGNWVRQGVGSMAGGVAGGTTGAAIGALVGTIFGPGGTAVGAFIGTKIGLILGMRNGFKNPKGKVTAAALGTLAGLAPVDVLKPPSD